MSDSKQGGFLNVTPAFSTALSFVLDTLEKPLYFNPFGQTGLLTLAIK
ncbi:hypothetical protein HMPREF9420_2766 [Segatella salivae DSM 15606]|uniref:Uncharacterized protein n=1 Tax=Segatella salivae DSM 15606 TaxID=888832 RepID=E6MTE8_9BACT|nr:hypothetical protein HMPREF9420_2766 [Segatella salivae DSM 15606]